MKLHHKKNKEQPIFTSCFCVSISSDKLWSTSMNNESLQALETVCCCTVCECGRTVTQSASMVIYTVKSLLSKTYAGLISLVAVWYVSMRKRHIIKLFQTQLWQCRQQLDNTCACGSGMAVTSIRSSRLK